MTNFEKWKNKLTVEQFCTFVLWIRCRDCPVFRVESCRGLGKKDCHKMFMNWANEEVLDDE